MKTFYHFLPVALASLLAIAGCSNPESSTFASVEQLKEGFTTPPPTSRPGVYWYFMDGNLSKEGITKDLESMDAVGIGYVVFLEVNVGVPRGNVDFMSQEWMDIFCHAVKECERLGIQMILGIGPGWTGSGGPWVKGEQSMQHLVSSTTLVEGGGKVSVDLAVPAPNPPFFGEGAFTPQMKKDWEVYYQDVTVLAFPTPAGDERISDIQEKALYIRAPFSSQPGVKQYLPSSNTVVAGSGKAEDSSVNPSDIIDLTAMMDGNGHLEWDAPEGNWTVMRFGARNNGAATRPAPVPGVGMECDKFSDEALKAHLANFTDKLFDALGERPETFGGIKFFHMDSWEMGAQNWTGDFREEFMKRRGYDPMPYYPVYSGFIVGDRYISERFLFDVRLTCQELVLENHSGAVREYAHKHGALASVEPYDMNPTADLELACSMDVPMAEFWSECKDGGFGYNTAFASAEGSSAAHLIGCNVVPAESFTSDHDGWRQSPARMKNQTDWAYGAGISRLIFHTFQHQCLADTLKPGMTMGPYGVHWDRNQTFWPMVSGYHDYLQRSQFLLQQGRTVADILYLTPESVPHAFKAPDSAYDFAGTFLPDRKAYSFDACPPSMIRKASVKDGCVVFPSGASYRILMLPDYDTATPEYLETIYSLVKAGATVVGRPPVSSPSLTDYPACDVKVKDVAGKIWGDGGEKIRKVGKGTVILLGDEVDNLYLPYPQTAQILSEMGVAPDMTCTGGHLRYTHRTCGGAEVYFLSNRTDEDVVETITFRVKDMVPELWNPVTGEMEALPEYSQNGDVCTLDLAFEGWQSFFVVFSPEGSGAAARKSNILSEKCVCDVASPWNVSFDPEWGTSETLEMKELASWTTFDDPLVRYYSGTATYQTEFEFEGDVPADCVLDLGCVREIARVRLNGQELGILWTSPWKIDVGGALRSGSNKLEIEVANLWQNRLTGDARGEKCIRHTFTTWNHASTDEALFDSGLLGPVKIVERY